MIITLRIPVTQKDYERLKEAKGDRNWHEFIMQLAKPLGNPEPEEFGNLE